MKLTLKIWRQKGANTKGSLQTYPIDGIDGDMSFLEMLDVLNEQLIEKGDEPVVFANVLIPPPLNPAAINRVTLDFPLVPLT